MATSLPVKLWIEGSRFVAECPSLGVVGEGTTREEALSHLRTAVSLYVDGPSPRLEVSDPLGDGP